MLIDRKECPYQDVCSIIIYWSEEKHDFISEVCRTSQYKQCLHYVGSGSCLKVAQERDKVRKEFLETHKLVINLDTGQKFFVESHEEVREILIDCFFDRYYERCMQEEV